MQFIDLIPRIREPEVLQLLTLAMGTTTCEALESVSDLFASTPGRFAFGLLEKEQILAVIGGQREGKSSASITHIAVRPDCRQAGLGRELIQHLRDRLALHDLVAQTDRDAVHFYERCGFTIQSLGELYPNVERFDCRWRAL